MSTVLNALKAVRAVGLAFVDRKRIDTWVNRADNGTPVGSIEWQMGDLDLALAQLVEVAVGGPRK